MEEQALAIFNQAAEQMRFERSLQWQIAEYAVLAYAALAAVWLALDRAGWGTWWVRLVAVLLVIATWYQALDGLYNSETSGC